MLLDIEQRRIEPDITVVALSGRFALGHESQHVESIIHELVKSGDTRAIMDLTGVTYIDSAAVGLIALAAGLLKEAGGRLVVIAPEGKVLDLLKITQMNLLVTVCPTESDAASQFAIPQPPPAPV